MTRIDNLKQQIVELKDEVIKSINSNDIFQASLKMMVLLSRDVELKTMFEKEKTTTRYITIGPAKEHHHNCAEFGCLNGNKT